MRQKETGAVRRLPASVPIGKQRLYDIHACTRSPVAMRVRAHDRHGFNRISRLTRTVPAQQAAHVDAPRRDSRFSSVLFVGPFPSMERSAGTVRILVVVGRRSARDHETARPNDLLPGLSTTSGGRSAGRCDARGNVRASILAGAGQRSGIERADHRRTVACERSAKCASARVRGNHPRALGR